MTISVCIGSACHLKGSYDVRMNFQNYIDQYNLGDIVNLEVAFCLGRCKDGVTIKVDDEIITGVTKENSEDIFKEKVLKKLNIS